MQKLLSLSCTTHAMIRVKSKATFLQTSVVKLVAVRSELEKSFLLTEKPQSGKENKETQNKENNQQNRFDTERAPSIQQTEIST